MRGWDLSSTQLPGVIIASFFLINTSPDNATEQRRVGDNCQQSEAAASRWLRKERSAHRDQQGDQQSQTWGKSDPCRRKRLVRCKRVESPHEWDITLHRAIAARQPTTTLRATHLFQHPHWWRSITCQSIAKGLAAATKSLIPLGWRRFSWIYARLLATDIRGNNVDA